MTREDAARRFVHDAEKRRYIIVDARGYICGPHGAGVHYVIDTAELARVLLGDCKRKRPGSYQIIPVSLALAARGTS